MHLQFFSTSMVNYEILGNVRLDWNRNSLDIKSGEQKDGNGKLSEYDIES